MERSWEGMGSRGGKKVAVGSSEARLDVYPYDGWRETDGCVGTGKEKESRLRVRRTTSAVCMGGGGKESTQVAASPKAPRCRLPCRL